MRASPRREPSWCFNRRFKQRHRSELPCSDQGNRAFKRRVVAQGLAGGEANRARTQARAHSATIAPCAVGIFRCRTHARSHTRRPLGAYRRRRLRHTPSCSLSGNAPFTEAPLTPFFMTSAIDAMVVESSPPLPPVAKHPPCTKLFPCFLPLSQFV